MTLEILVWRYYGLQMKEVFLLEISLHYCSGEDAGQASKDNHLPNCGAEAEQSSRNGNTGQRKYEHWLSSKSIRRSTPRYHQAHLCQGEQGLLETQDSVSQRCIRENHTMIVSICSYDCNVGRVERDSQCMILLHLNVQNMLREVSRCPEFGCSRLGPCQGML